MKRPILFLIIINSTLIAQETNLDWHMIEIGPIRQLITNQGIFGGSNPNSQWGNDTNYEGPYNTEYPLGGLINYGNFMVNVGAKRGGIASVTAGGPWLGEGEGMKEWYPTAEPWDTVGVINGRKTVDIPYWPAYTGISDQDVVCRYNDYGPASRVAENHNPLGVEVIQVSYAWNSMEFLIHQFYIIPRQADLTDFYFGIWGAIGIHQIGSGNLVGSFTYFNEERRLALVTEKQGGVPLVGPEAFRLFTDEEDEPLGFTYTNQYFGEMALELPPQEDSRRYVLMSTPGIYLDHIQGIGYGYFFYSVGPYKEVAIGDTVHVTLAQLFGKGDEGVFKNYDRLLQLRAQNYHLPAPPPSPPLRFEVANHQITLHWDPQTGEADHPENYTDEYRLDGDPEPFEGYRVYKSLVGRFGPWTLLAEYDRIDDDIGEGIGLEYSYTDEGLLNNLEYYYTVTAYSKPDTIMAFPSQESSPNANAVTAIPGTATPETVGQVAVVPNPYRGDEKYYNYQPAWEKPSLGNVWLEEDRRIQFINLPSPCEIKIYTVSGKFVNSLRHDNPDRGFKNWNLTSHVGQAIASGVYLFTVKDIDNDQIQTGKFVVIK